MFVVDFYEGFSLTYDFSNIKGHVSLTELVKLGAEALLITLKTYIIGKQLSNNKRLEQNLK